MRSGGNGRGGQQAGAHQLRHGRDGVLRHYVTIPKLDRERAEMTLRHELQHCSQAELRAAFGPVIDRLASQGTPSLRASSAVYVVARQTEQTTGARAASRSITGWS